MGTVSRHLKSPQRLALTVFRARGGDFRGWTELRNRAGGIADALQAGRRL